MDRDEGSSNGSFILTLTEGCTGITFRKPSDHRTDRRCERCQKSHQVRKLKRCGRCYTSFFCSQICFREGWGEHQSRCFPIYRFQSPQHAWIHDVSRSLLYAKKKTLLKKILHIYFRSQPWSTTDLCFHIYQDRPTSVPYVCLDRSDGSGSGSSYGSSSGSFNGSANGSSSDRSSKKSTLNPDLRSVSINVLGVHTYHAICKKTREK